MSKYWIGSAVIQKLPRIPLGKMDISRDESIVINQIAGNGNQVTGG